jgi:hypothetical protein
MVARSTVQDYIRRATAKNLSCAQLNQLNDSEAQQLLGKGRCEFRKLCQLDREEDPEIMAAPL